MKIPPFFCMWMNGQPLTQTSLDRGLQFGDGHFTTLVIQAGTIQAWSSHWQRLQYASQQLRMQLPSADEVLHLLQQIAQQHPQSVIKIIITRGASARGYRLDHQARGHWYVQRSELPPWTARPLRVALAHFKLAQQPMLAGLKSLNRLEQVLLSDECEQRGFDDLLVTDTQANIIEATSSNIFWYDGKQWCTPRLEQAGIAGVVRKQLIDKQIIGKVKLTKLRPAELAQVEQMFVCNCVLGPRPIAAIDGRMLAMPELPKELNQWDVNASLLLA
ncbi:MULTISPECIES: aminodeoxychorismate lyase [Pseudidiomarina]|uniref:Aminodeoxychorismate lyase n=2 Tax=Pseudidiomarina TaxID=2800384 RepID=A0A368V840_9GAMM|nr:MULTISPECIES: aminodeoxychorismate lyase [Pseudidiomarina]PWW15197.1 aminodeoxychorismate lyase apoprotein [Pseudidiomarina maritima]RBP89621.1 aminodeoxychorismate lyase apoprotein [Pseudidiomarina tainanensis]RCW35171.1 aminodeoxychorismate lyase apoprotein [Pseudidiomarina tainanensis]